jgi:hypothetical protein
MKATSSPTSRTARKPARHSTSWAAAELGVCKKTVLHYIATGQLNCTTLPGGHFRITDADIRECLGLSQSRTHKRVEEPATQPKSKRKPRQRRAPLGVELPTSPLDLSPAALDALRSRYAAA